MNLPDNTVSAIVLGIMQDAGLPHIGCRCPRCAASFEDTRLAEYAACLGIVDTRSQPPAVWLVDATPDIKHQLNMLANVLGPHPTMPGRERQPDGLFLTHAHMGHTAGLPHLGPEGMNVHHLPVYASAGLVEVLQQTLLWQPLVDLLKLISIEPELPIELADALSITPVSVPHRDELEAGTFAYRIQGPTQSILYIPDIDSWDLWLAALDQLSTVDVAIVDASFYDWDELAGQTSRLNYAQPTHPLVPDTLRFFADLDTELVLTHINHTNPLLDINSGSSSIIEGAGALIAYTGMTIRL